MTKPIGKLRALFLLLALLAICSRAHSTVEATVDRNQVATGDTIRLTVTATEDDEDISGIDLTPLLQDFEILQRSTKSSTSIINGSRTHSRQLVMEITPRRSGKLLIPPLRVGAKSTRPVQVVVKDAQPVDPGQETVLFEAVLDQEEVYVQGQLILTLRLQQAINLDGRSISELQLPGAFVVPLEQKSFQRTMNGRPWLVHEVRYAIFPEQSGTLEIPAQSFSARESTPRRSLFDTGGRGRLVRRETPTLNVEVLPRPDNYPSTATWLPARELVLQETWSSDPAQLRAGESVTRTIQLRGEGLQGAQLPPVVLPPVEGLKYYPDQPSINDAEVASGLLGTRDDSTAIVPTLAGQLELPEVRVPWWDSDTGELRFAVLPARTLQIGAAETLNIPTSPTATTAGNISPAQADGAPGGSSLLWQSIALFLALGWLVTLYFLLRKGKLETLSAEAPAQSPSVRKAYKQLLAACASNSASQARKALLLWSAATADDEDLRSLAQVDGFFADADLKRELDTLEQSLYSSNQSDWRGDTLTAVVQRLQKENRNRKSHEEVSLSLYPGTA